MIRSAAARSLVSVWGLWFTVLSADASAIHSCPMHDGAGAGGHAAHMHMAHAADAGAPARHDTAAACTCMAPCCGSAAAITSQRESLRDVTATFVAASPASHHGVQPQPRAHALPFANGPPVSASL